MPSVLTADHSTESIRFSLSDYTAAGHLLRETAQPSFAYLLEKEACGDPEMVDPQTF